MILSCRRGRYSSAALNDVNSEEKLNEENYDEQFSQRQEKCQASQGQNFDWQNFKRRDSRSNELVPNSQKQAWRRRAPAWLRRRGRKLFPSCAGCA